jgi:hypothetical protein
MKWALTQSTVELHWWKLEQWEFFAELKYSKTAHTLRIKAHDRRLFFIEKAGFLQQKFLLRTEYNVVAGEVLPLKNQHSGILIFENRKFSYLLKDNEVSLTSKKENFSFTIEVDSTSMDSFEISALLFGSIRILSEKFKPLPVA